MAEQESVSPSTDGNVAPKVTINFKIGLIGGLIYLAIGLLWHLVTGDYEVFSWANPWLYVDALLWPLWLLGWVILAIIAIIAIIFVCVTISDWHDDRERKRKRREWEAKQAPATVEMYEASDERRRSDARQPSED